MNILLTGSSGFLGKYLTEELINYHNLFTLSRKNSTYNCQLDSEIPHFEHCFDLVIHSAGKAHIVPNTIDEMDEFYKNNVDGTRNLLAGILKVGIPRQFVFISSVSVYGLINGENIDESAPLLANDPYGKSKIMAEEIIKKWCEENNVVYTILRLPLVVGANPLGNLRLMINAISKGYYFNIDGGKSKKSMVLASDVAKFILLASQKGGIYNLTDGYHPSFYELSRYISKKLGKSNVLNIPFTIAKFISIVGDKIWSSCPINSNKLVKITSTLTFDDTKARDSFKWEPTNVLDGFNLTSNV